MNRIKDYIILQLIIIIFAFSSAISKVASMQEFLSFKFILFYGLLLVTLFVYALAWQQIIKKFPLTIASVSKATTIIWSMLIGYFLFNEAITIKNVIGAIIVIIGIIVMIKGESKNA